MNWYYVDAGRQAGPVDDAGLYALLGAGRITNETLVWREGLPDWQPFSSIRHGLAVMPPEPGAAPGWVTEHEALEREYRIDIGGALDRGWKTFTDNAGMSIGALVLVGMVFLAGMVISFLFAMVIPLSNLVANFFFMVPLTAGFSWFSLKLVRGEPAGIGDAFAGFSINYWQLVLFAMVQFGINFLCVLPMIMVALLTGLMGAFMGHHAANDMALGLMMGLIFGMLLTFCVAIYVNTLWTYTILLLMDKNYGFWQAMQLSRRMVSRRWWMTFLFLFVAGLFYLLGVMLCGVGLLATVPLMVNMLAILYDDNFRDLEPQHQR